MQQLYENIERVPEHWKKSCVGTECSLHQLSPYIGRLKSSIAHDLIAIYSAPGDLVVDPFVGSGTVALEALLQGRRTFTSDISAYAKILCEGKLRAPCSVERALQLVDEILWQSYKLPDPDLRRVPVWVRKFFHPRTLKKAINFATVCREKQQYFLFACFLGILHHQRPGFLSYPSSHLVPYLRERKYPKSQFPELYQYRELRPRLLSKIKRAYARCPKFESNGCSIHVHCSVQNLQLPKSFDCMITSPPYMNTLDYNRDNRLRLWFINPNHSRTPEDEVIRKREAFEIAIANLAEQVNISLKAKGYCIIIVGEKIARRPDTHLSRLVYEIIKEHAPTLKLQMIMKDDIPDIRRSRRDCRGTKTEHFLIFQKV